MMVRVLALLVALFAASTAWGQAAPKAPPNPPAAAPKAAPQAPAAAPKAAPAPAPVQAAPKAPPAPIPPPGLLPTATVAVLDSQYVLVNAAASKGIRTQIEAIRDVYSAEISQKEDQLRAQDQELARQQAILSPEAYAQRRRDFDATVEAVQRLVDDRNRQIDSTFTGAMTKVRDALLKVLGDLSVQRGFNIIVEKSDVLFASRTLDLTNEVIAMLDERLPSVEVPLPPVR